MPTCPLCTPEHETLLWQDNNCRIIRVIYQTHAKEISDLSQYNSSILEKGWRHLFPRLTLAIHYALPALMSSNKQFCCISKRLVGMINSFHTQYP